MSKYSKDPKDPNIKDCLNDTDSSSTEDSWSLIYFKGFVMGLSDSVPGISGSTIALLTNIYERLISAIRSINPMVLGLLFTNRRLQAWQNIDGTFLVILGAGVGSGIFIAAKTILFLYQDYREPLQAFFMGLVIASAWILRKKFSKKKLGNWFIWTIGVSFSASLINLDILVSEIGYFYIFLCGLIAISAMILPGLSGAFILIILGAYEFILNALVTWNLPFVFVFSLGCLTGLVIFSRLLFWLLSSFREQTYAFINGILVGSLNMLWPWQQVRELEGVRLNENIHQQVNILPSDYTEATGNAAMVVESVMALILSIVLVIYLKEFLFKQTKR